MIMNEEGISSLPVLDNQKNVVGNISHVDVKVRNINLSRLSVPIANRSLATDKVKLSSVAKLFMHSFHYRNTPRAGSERRAGFIPGFPYYSLFDTRAYSC